jgi:hypothetical protein
VKKTFLALGLEFGAVALLVMSLAVAAMNLTPVDAPYGHYEPSDPGTAATAF